MPYLLLKIKRVYQIGEGTVCIKLYLENLDLEMGTYNET